MSSGHASYKSTSIKPNINAENTHVDTNLSTALLDEDLDAIAQAELNADNEDGSVTPPDADVDDVIENQAAVQRPAAKASTQSI